MNEEIKEILHKWNKVCNKELEFIDLTLEQMKQLYDYINNLEDRIDKAIEYIEKSKLNQLDTRCKYLYVDFSTEKIEHLDDLLNILQGDDIN